MIISQTVDVNRRVALNVQIMPNVARSLCDCCASWLIVLEGKSGDYLTSSVLLCIIIVHIICTPI